MTKTATLHYLAAAQSVAAGEGLVLADGTIWSHAATLGERARGGEAFTIGPDDVTNAVKVFTEGYPRKIPVDYEHGSTTSDPEVRKLRVQGSVPKAGDVVELKAVVTPADFTGELKASAEKMSAVAGRPLEDPRNLGLWMRWKPTSRALAAIKAGEYTELSIAFDGDMPHNVDERGQGFGLWAVALLNRPFLDDMLPVAASRDRDPPARPAPHHTEEDRMTKVAVTMLSALTALIAKPVNSEEEAVVELQALGPEMTRLRSAGSFRDAIVAELGGETDPAKAVTQIKELKAQIKTATDAAAAAKKKELSSVVETTMTKYEKRMTLPLKTQMAKQLSAELEAGKKLEETETVKALESMPEIGSFAQATGVDTGAGKGTDGEKLVAKTRELMATPEFQKIEQAQGWSAAFRQAGVRAEKELGLTAK